MSLKDIAQETLKIIQEGFVNSSGKVIDFALEQKAAEAGTILYTPEQLSQLLAKSVFQSNNQPIIEVTEETTQTAAHRLVTTENCSDLVLLNYASACNPGGGFLNGAKAQEEDLARCSGLYPCLLTQPDYYEINRAYESLLYTDYIIYSPKVPWFKTSSSQLLEDFFLASVITAPAPNAGQFLRRNRDAHSEVEEALRRRAGYVLTVARENGHRSLLLGAWGCGVFRNDPYHVASAFFYWLVSPKFKGCFDRVVFAIYDPTQEKNTLKAFQHLFVPADLASDLEEELKINNPPLPLWLKHPEIERYSIGWRMGYGEWYKEMWWLWAESQSHDDLTNYFKKFAPIPVEWADWVAHQLFEKDSQDEEERDYQEYKERNKLLVKKLSQIGLVNFDKWSEWYSQEGI